MIRLIPSGPSHRRDRQGASVNGDEAPAGTVLPVLTRHAWLLTVIFAAAALVALVAAGVWAWLLPPTGGAVAAVPFGLILWLTLASAGCATVVLRDLRPGRRITVTVIAVFAVLLLCGAPAGWFWTYAVQHTPDGQTCAECAVDTYFAAGPLAGQLGNSAELDQVLCSSRAGQLREQQAKLAADLQVTATNTGLGFPRAVLGADGAKTATPGGMTIVEHVAWDFPYPDGKGPAGAILQQTTYHLWTFHLVHVDGWQICQVDAPVMCQILNCHPATAPAPSAVPSPTCTEGLCSIYPSNLASMLPCGPADPFRQYHQCPATSPRPSTPATS